MKFSDTGFTVEENAAFNCTQFGNGHHQPSYCQFEKMSPVFKYLP